jgi:hypothetical protein
MVVEQGVAVLRCILAVLGLGLGALTVGFTYWCCGGSKTLRG